EKIKKIQQQNQPSKKGNLNPMFGKKQSELTRKRISDSQKARYNALRAAIRESSVLSFGQDDIEARKDVLRQCLEKNNISFQSIQQAINFICIILGKDYIKEIFNEEINKIIK
ncbi:MAG: hypothetical protein J5663_07370, partial [Bacteroidaceae bacterium]|nr:hypothetical protein [Bacteroidaceae bacterium]